MIDASIRGWLLILAGAALTLFAARRKRSEPARPRVSLSAVSLRLSS